MTTPYVDNGNIGVSLSGVFTPSTSLYPWTGGALPNFPVGKYVTALNNSVWVRVLIGTGGVTGAGYVCTINSAFTAVMMSNSVGAFGDKIGVPVVAASAGDYIWLQVYGTCDAVRVAASCVANVPLASTTSGTPGVLDDAVANPTKNIPGLVITTTVVGAGATPGELNYPTVGTTN